MAQKIKIGIPFHFNERWIAGSYYIANLINALSLLSENKRPEVVVFYKEDESLKFFKDISYPYIDFRKEKLNKLFICLQRTINRCGQKIFRSDLVEFRPKNKDINVLFPAEDGYSFDLIQEAKKIYWIPDFQDYFLPNFFSKEEIDLRQKYRQSLVDRGAALLFSSYSTLKDFNEIYPKNSNKTHVLQFAAAPQKKFEKINIERLLIKYALPEQYLICSNQFWAHKNHITVLKALKILKKSNIFCKIIFTGAPKDFRNETFYQNLLEYITRERLNDYVVMSGLIDRDEQLGLMAGAAAIVQPSLFEGWSTVVEEAKLMNKHIILSDLSVHREQCGENATFFDAKNAEELSEALLSVLSGKINNIRFNYQQNQLKFAESFLKIIQSTGLQ
jgi:glycosyltransferase involved in cell wall biosynthesis